MIFGSRTSTHGFGRLPSEPDKRDYKMADIVPQLERLSLPERMWHSSRVLNQGREPHCVGFSWAGWGIASPVEDPWDDAMGHDIYKACKLIDGMPDVDGSSVRAGAKVMRKRGHFKTFFFASSIIEAADYVSRFGPVVLGTDWYRSMSRPSVLGRMKVSGPVVGGHAYLWVGVSRGDAIILNSWGPRFGKNGTARISLRDLMDIFVNHGEACAATEVELRPAA